MEGTSIAQTLTCASLGNNTITPSAGANGTLSPATALNVPNKVVSTFTVTPNAGYQIASVSGCGGTLSGNTFTTAPATASCTVAATFAPVPYTVTASAGAGGSINPSGAVSVASGTTKAFTLTPNSGYVISSVGGTCGGTLSGNTYTTKAITASCTVAPVFAQASTYTVTISASEGGTVSPLGSVSVAAGSTQMFTVTPSFGRMFSSGSDTCGTTTAMTTQGGTYTTKPITANCAIEVIFGYLPYTISVGAGTGGTISPSGNITAFFGKTSQFTITPDSGYRIASVGGTCGGTLNGNTYITNGITTNCTVIPVFVQITTYSITASAVANWGTVIGGTISPSGTISGIASGTTKTFTLTSSSGYYLTSVGGSCGGTLSGNIYTTSSITSNCTVTAGFAPQTYTITSSSNTGGTVTPLGTVSIASGNTQSFTVASTSGGVYSIGGTCGTSSVSGNTWTIKPVTANCTFIVSFNNTITTSAGTGGTISPSGGVGAPNGTTKTFTVTPDSGYRIASVGGTCGGTLSGNTYTTNVIATNCSVTASFGR